MVYRSYTDRRNLRRKRHRLKFHRHVGQFCSQAALLSPHWACGLDFAEIEKQSQHYALAVLGVGSLWGHGDREGSSVSTLESTEARALIALVGAITLGLQNPV